MKFFVFAIGACGAAAPAQIVAYREGTSEHPSTPVETVASPEVVSGGVKSGSPPRSGGRALFSAVSGAMSGLAKRMGLSGGPNPTPPDAPNRDGLALLDFLGYVSQVPVSLEFPAYDARAICYSKTEARVLDATPSVAVKAVLEDIAHGTATSVSLTVGDGDLPTEIERLITLRFSNRIRAPDGSERRLGSLETDLLRLKADLTACDNGWADQPLSETHSICSPPVGVSVRTAESTPVFSELLRCYIQREQQLPPDLRKRISAMDTIVKDVERPGPPADYGSANMDSEVMKDVMGVCKQLVAVFTFETVPWLTYTQGFPFPCLVLYGMARLSPELAWKGTVVLLDQVAQVTRVPGERMFEYVHVLTSHLAGFIRSHFPDIVELLNPFSPVDELGEPDFRQALSNLVTKHLTFVGMPDVMKSAREDKLRVLAFTLRHGRPGLMALLIAALQQGAHGDEDEKPAYVINPLPCNNAAACTALVDRVLPLAEELLAREFQVMRPVEPVAVTQPARKSRFSLKHREKHVEVDPEEVVAVGDSTPLTVSFPKLVDMIDALVADTLSNSKYDIVRFENTGDENAAAAALLTRRFPGIAFPSAAQVERVGLRSESDGLCAVAYGPHVAIDVSPTVASVAKAMAILDGTAAPGNTGIVVDGQQRVLSTSSFEEHLAALDEELKLCTNGALGPADTFQGCQRLMPSKSGIMDGKADWFLAPLVSCLEASPGTAPAVVQQHLVSLANVVLALHSLALPPVVRESCEKVLAVYTVRIVNEPAPMLPYLVSWCADLRGTLEISEQETLAMLVRMGNQISGLTRHGHRRHLEYVHVLASYWVAVAVHLWPAELAARWAGLSVAERVTVVASLTNLLETGAIPPSTSDHHRAVWAYVVANGRHGMMALAMTLFRNAFTRVPIDSPERVIQTLVTLSNPYAAVTPATGLMDAAETVRTQNFELAGGARVTFGQISDMVDALVDGAMARNQYATSVLRPH